MKTGIIGVFALCLGIWALVSWWWVVVEIIHVLLALALVTGGGMAIAVEARRIRRAKQTGE